MMLRRRDAIVPGVLLAALLAAQACKVVTEEPGKAGKAQEAAGAASAPAQGPTPVIACDQPDFDYGAVAQGEDAKHTFTVKNTGAGVLKIDRAQGG